MGPKESEPLLWLGVVEGGPDDPTPGVPGWSSTDTEHTCGRRDVWTRPVFWEQG